MLNGEAGVITCENEDVTESYLKGGRKSLEIAEAAGAKLAILKANSPSCGCGKIFSENFANKKSGDGTTTALFKRAGIKIKTELNYKKDT